MANRWRIELLGRLQAVIGNRSVNRFRYQKSGELLAFLAFYSDQAHSRGELQELLWPGSDPEASQLRLRVVLASLRRQLESPGTTGEGHSPAGAVLVADRHTIRLNAALCVTDVALFETSLRAAERAGNPAERAQRWAEAVEWYGGELLPGRHEEWIVLERERLGEAFQQAVGALVERWEAAGDPRRALQYARWALAADSLREESHHAVIRLLAALGERGAARRQYEELERLLAETAGVTPAPEIQQLIAGITGDQSPPVATWQTPSLSVSSTTSLAAAPAHSPAAGTRALTPRPEERPRAQGYLPLLPNRFYGREAEVARLCELLGEGVGGWAGGGYPPNPRLVTLTGPGGSGKTRLAIETTYRLWERFGGAIWFVALADLRDARLLPEKLQETLHLPGSVGPDLLEQVAAAVSERPALLVLDNFEQLLSPTGPERMGESGSPGHYGADGSQIVRRLLDGVPNLTCLVTSRQRLGLSGEREFPVPPLPTPVGSEQWAVGSENRTAAAGLSTDHCSLLTVPSVQLFLDRAQAIRPDFRLTPHNAAAVAELCRRLEGLPLALELAAGRVWVLTPTQMLARLSERFELLVGRQRDAGYRHHSLRAALEWSYELLSPEAKQSFARLSVFRGGWTAEAATAVCDFGFRVPSGRLDFGLGPTKTRDGPEPLSLSAIQNPKSKIQNIEGLLEELRECSLVVSEMPGGGHSLPRHAGDGGQEPAAPESPSGLASVIGQLAPEETMRFRMLETLREFAAEQLSPAEQRAVEARHTAYFLSLAEECEARWAAGSGERRLDQLEREFDNLRAAFTRCQAPEGDGETALRLAHAMFRLWYAQGHPEDLRQRLLELLDHPRAQGRSAARAWVLKHAGTLAATHGDAGPAAAVPLLQESLAIFRTLNERAGIAAVVNSLALVAVSCAEMQALYEESLEIGREVGDPGRVADQLYNLSLVALWQGEYGRARPLVDEAMEIWKGMKSEGGIGLALSQYAAVATCEKDMAAARRHLEEALELFRRRRNWLRLGQALQGLGQLTRITGDAALSRSYSTEALALAREVSNAGFAASALLGLAELALDENNGDEAEQLLREALPFYRAAMRSVGPERPVFVRQNGAPASLSRCLDCLAWLARQRGEREETRALHAEIVTAAVAADDFRGLAAALEHRARRIASSAGPESLPQAALLLGAADALRRRPGTPVSGGVDLWEQDRCQTTLRAALDDATYTAAWSEGQSHASDLAFLTSLLEIPLRND